MRRNDVAIVAPELAVHALPAGEPRATVVERQPTVYYDMSPSRQIAEDLDELDFDNVVTHATSTIVAPDDGAFWLAMDVAAVASVPERDWCVFEAHDGEFAAKVQAVRASLAPGPFDDNVGPAFDFAKFEAARSALRADAAVDYGGVPVRGLFGL